MKLEKERKYFKKNKTRLLKEHKGKFILIKGEKEHGVFSNFKDAHKEALEKFGTDQVLIQEITDEKSVNYYACIGAG